MTESLPPPIETLLAEREWVRRVARSLVADPAAADDLEQDTWLAAVEKPPRHGNSVRGWLATVLHRAAGRARRDAYRRDRRESAAPSRKNERSAADVVAEAELHRRVVDAVLALSEPFRTAVLLRFFEGLPPREIAARTATSAETARSRVRRGVDDLRARFDAEHRGDRRAWAASMAGLAGIANDGAGEPLRGDDMPARSVGTRPRVPLVAAAIVAGVVAAIAIPLTLLRTPRDGEVGESATAARNEADARPNEARTDDTRDPALAARPPADDSSGAAASRSATPAASRHAFASATNRASIRGRVTTEDGHVVPAATVAAYAYRDYDGFREVVAPVRTGADGRYAISGLEGDEVTVVARADGLVAHGLSLVRGDASNPLAVALRGGESVERDLVIEPAVPIAGLVFDLDGSPAGGCEVLGEVVGSTNSSNWLFACAATTQDDGRFVLSGVPAKTTIRIEARREGRWRARVGPVWNPDGLPSPLELRLGAARSIDVQVVAAETGAAVANASVGASITTRPVVGERVASATSDEHGRARLLDVPSVPVDVFAWTPREAVVALDGRASISADSTSATLRLETRRARTVPEGVTLVETRARIVDPQGKPIPLAMAGSYHWEPSHAGGGGGGGGCSCGPIRHGEGSLGKSWPPNEFAEAFAPKDDEGAPLPYGGAVVAIEGRDLVEIRLVPEREIRGRVVDADGSPVTGVLVQARPTRWALPMRTFSYASERTEPDGSFRLGQLADEEYEVDVVPPADHGAPEAVRVKAGANDVSIALHRLDDVVATFVDDDGRPVAGVRVTVWVRTAADWRVDSPARPTSNGVSDRDGHARLRGLDAQAKHHLVADPPESRTDLLRRDEPAWVPGRASTIRVSSGVHLRVVDGAGRPVEGARVGITQHDRSNPAAFSPVATADHDGVALWREPPASGARVVALAPGAEPTRGVRPSYWVRPGDDATLVVSPGAPIDLELAGAPRGESIDVEAYGRDENGKWNRADSASTTSETARVFVGDLESAYAIRARTRDRSQVAYVERATAGSKVRLVLAPSLRIAGRVSAPPDEARVRVDVVQGDGPLHESTTADDHGDFALNGLVAGHYRVSASTHDGTLRADGEADAGGTLDLVLRSR